MRDRPTRVVHSTKRSNPRRTVRSGGAVYTQHNAGAREGLKGGRRLPIHACSILSWFESMRIRVRIRRGACAAPHTSSRRVACGDVLSRQPLRLSPLQVGEKKNVKSAMLSSYHPALVEARWYEWWEKCGFFTPQNGSSKPKFTIVIPPPNVTGVLHIGHALTNSVQDTLVRWKRMQGASPPREKRNRVVERPLPSKPPPNATSVMPFRVEYHTVRWRAGCVRLPSTSARRRAGCEPSSSERERRYIAAAGGIPKHSVTLASPG